MGGKDRYTEFHSDPSPRGFPANSQTWPPDFPDPAGSLGGMDNNTNFGYEPTATYPASRAGGRTGGRGRMIAGGVAAAVLVGGAAFGAVTMLSSSPAAAATGGPTGQAAVLNDALTTAT